MQLDAVKHPNKSGMYDTFHANIEEKEANCSVPHNPAASIPRPYFRKLSPPGGARTYRLRQVGRGDEELGL
jgi:hypothetical protein